MSKTDLYKEQITKAINAFSQKRFDEAEGICLKILSENNVNLLSLTTRYVPKNTEIFLDYNPVDMVAVVLYFNV